MNKPEDLKSSLDEQKFEVELVRMMRRVDPPTGFAERVMVRVTAAAQTRTKVMVMRPRSRVWFSGAIAAALLVGIFFTEQTHLRREREQVAQAQSQFEAGIEITDRALEHTRRQLQRAGVGVGD